MADIYLRSTDGSDASDGLTWANAKATLAAALTAAGAGGRVWRSKNHAETQASAMTLTSPGTAASPVQILTVEDAGDPEPPTTLATGATISTTLSSTITFAGYAYDYGGIYSGGSGVGAIVALQFGGGAGFHWIFEAGSLRKGTTTSGTMIFGTAGAGNPDAQFVELINTTIHPGAAGDLLRPRCRIVWRDTPSAVGGTVPTTLFSPEAGQAPADIEVRGVDLSALGSGKTIVNVAADNSSRLLFVGCKLGASVSRTTGTPAAQGGVVATFLNCDSADTNYVYQKTCYQGDITHETTIVRTGGASDGTTPIARKMVSSANAKFVSPLESDPIVFWNETVGSAITVTIEGLTDGVTLTDAQAWMEVEAPTTSGNPITSVTSDRAANVLATPTNQDSSSAAWTTTGLSSPVKQKFSVTLTPQEKGLVAVRVKLARASTTLYVDPLPVVS